MIDIKELQQQPEGQLFDRKSFRIDAKALGVILVAFANADGGDVVIGIEDDGRITGINGNEDHLNELILPQYPPFCWTELIVNAVAHRDYSILGTDIMVKIFDHHYVVESPGILPGMVRIDNIRQMHFSRNPKIAEFMREYKLVKEFGEGVDRMFREMAEAGNPAPEYKQVEFMVKVRLNSALREETVEKSVEETTQKSGQKNDQKSTLKGTLKSTLKDNNDNVVEQETVDKSSQKTTQKTTQKILKLIKNYPEITKEELAEKCGITLDGIKWQLKKLKSQGIIRRVGPDKGGYWEVVEPDEKGGE